MALKKQIEMCLVVAFALAVWGYFFEASPQEIATRYTLWSVSGILICMAIRFYLSKQCQFCRRVIPGKATACMHCGRELYVVLPGNRVVLERRFTQPQLKKKTADGGSEILSSIFQNLKKFAKLYLTLLGALCLVIGSYAFYDLFSISANGDPDNKILLEAVKKGKLDEVKSLTPNVATLDFIRGDTPLVLAADKGFEDLVEFFLNQGANPNWRNVSGEDTQFALGVSAAHGNLDQIKLLLDHRANIELKDAKGMTALHIAVDNHQMEAVKMLLSRGAKVGSQDLLGRTPLHLAVRKNFEDIGLYLFEHGAPLNTQDKMGDTPLMIARYMKRDWLYQAAPKGGR